MEQKIVCSEPSRPWKVTHYGPWQIHQNMLSCKLVSKKGIRAKHTNCPIVTFSPNGQSSSLKCLIKFNLESFIVLALVPIICSFGHCLGCLSTWLPTAKIKNQAAPGSINGWLGILGSGGQKCLCNHCSITEQINLMACLSNSIFRCLVPKPFLQGGKENSCSFARVTESNALISRKLVPIFTSSNAGVRLVSCELLATCKTAVRIRELIALVQTSAAGVRHFLRSFSLQFCPRLSWKLLLGRTTAHELQRKQWIWYNKFIEFCLGLSGSRRLLSAATRWCFLPGFRCNLHAERKGLKFKGLVLVELSNGACRNAAFFFWQQ